ncbi:hypothetical protein DL98DRAFT_529924 [Cadophora sp. DSE1049]|nr:hypothetical protein DL98DRAFT_529924 [Cadophora sp. DSE1049]
MAPILCEFCYPRSYDFASQASLEDHIRRKHPTERVRNRFSDPPASSDVDSQCTYCGPGSFVYAHNESLKAHIRNKHSEDQLWCKFCGVGSFVFTSKDALRRHIQDKHSTESQLVCEICGTFFYTRRGFRDHVRNKVCLNPKETGGLHPNATSETSGFASNGAGQRDTAGYLVTHEDFHAYIQSHSQPDTDDSGMGGIGENYPAEGPLADEEYQTYMQSYWQQDAGEVFNPNALHQNYQSQDFGMLDPSQLAQAASTSTPNTIDQDQSISAQVAIASAHEFGFDFDALEQLDSSGNRLTESSMTTEEYQSYLRSIGI